MGEGKKRSMDVGGKGNALQQRDSSSADAKCEWEIRGKGVNLEMTGKLSSNLQLQCAISMKGAGGKPKGEDRFG